MATGSVLASTAGYAYASAEAHGGAANSPGVGSGNSVQAPVDIPVNACGNTVNVVGLLNPAMGNNCGNVSHGGSAVHGGQIAPGEHSPSGHGSPDGAGDYGTGDDHGGPTGSGGPAHAGSGASSQGGAQNSPGVISGNSAQAPISIPVNACGNSVNVIGVGNPAVGNDCGNHGATEVTPPSHPQPVPGDDCPPGETGTHVPPRSAPPVSTPPTGTDTGGGSHTPPAATVSQPQAPQQSLVSPPSREQLASTGASGLELIAPAGVALLLAGGVLYRRARAGAR
ncbi:chaplin [Saccharothrix sp. ST-888]|uniref:chaplin n=1 Tax=Saccharothrix sp. ST-888 TaxID=1427391 RepID=UPI001E619FE9|nr:chaplin family protein [Saccharothrix sp. ST-888]